MMTPQQSVGGVPMGAMPQMPLGHPAYPVMPVMGYAYTPIAVSNHLLLPRSCTYQGDSPGGGGGKASDGLTGMCSGIPKIVTPLQ